METSARRLVDRKLIPSENIPRIWARFSSDNLFMSAYYNPLNDSVKHNIQFV